MKKLFLLFGFCLISNVWSQQLTGPQVVERAIAYHDPNNNWATFNDTLLVTMKTPTQPNRNSTIVINLPKRYFYVKATRGNNTTEYTINKGECQIAFNGNTSIPDSIAKAHNLNCDRANLYKNYYTYLYGLPMKLKDAGTNIHPNVSKKTFKGKEYLVVKVTYDANVGSDVWYFYFNPKTYAMEVYQFFKTDEKGKEKPDSGEYILLTGIKEVSGIKIPKNRAWYYNKDNKYLGTDYLK